MLLDAFIQGLKCCSSLPVSSYTLYGRDKPTLLSGSKVRMQQWRGNHTPCGMAYTNMFLHVLVHAGRRMRHEIT